MSDLSKISSDWRLLPLALLSWVIAVLAIKQYWYLILFFNVALIISLAFIWKFQIFRFYLLAVLLIASIFSLNIYVIHFTTVKHPIYKFAKLGSYAKISAITIHEVKNQIELIKILEINGENYLDSQHLPRLVIDLKFKDSNTFSEILPGTKIIISGKLQLYNSQISVTVKDFQILSDSDLLTQNITQVRKNLNQVVKELPWESKTLIPALIFGDTTAIPKTLITDFKHSGLMHLMAVSGANLAILLNFSLALAARIGIRGYWRMFLMINLTLFFVLLCQFEPSVLRAAAMALVVVPSLSRNNGLRQLSLAIIMLLLIYPNLAISWGFALSVLATLGILVLSPRLKSAWQDYLGVFGAEFLAVPIAAQIATTPVVIALSGVVSIVSLPANLLAAPIVAPVTITGIILTLLAQISVSLAYYFAWVPLVGAEIIKVIAQYSVLLPGAYLQVSNSTLVILLSVIIAGISYFCLTKLRFYSFIITNLVLVMALIFAPWINRSTAWKIAICQAEKTQIFFLAQTKDQVAAIIFTESSALERELIACQNKIGRMTLDTIIYNSGKYKLIYPKTKIINLYETIEKISFGDFEVLHEKVLGHYLIYEKLYGNSVSIYSKTMMSATEDFSQDPSQIIVMPNPQIPLASDKYLISAARITESENKNLFLLASGDILKISFINNHPKLYR